MWKLGRLWAMFRKELLMAWAVLRDPRAPRAAKLATVLAVLYVVSPIDLVSDFIPILGWLDDGLIASLLLQLAFKFLPADLMASLRAKVETRCARSRSKVNVGHHPLARRPAPTKKGPAGPFFIARGKKRPPQCSALVSVKRP